jgi:hypothetical protein
MLWLRCLPEGANCNLCTGRLHLLVTTPSYSFFATGVVPGHLGVVRVFFMHVYNHNEISMLSKIYVMHMYISIYITDYIHSSKCVNS